MKKAILVFVITIVLIGGGVFFWLANAKKSMPNQKPGTLAPAATQKSGTTTKTGKVSNINGVFYLQETGQTPKEIDSYSVELKDYVGQMVTVSGQYSGDTLFVGSIENK